MHNTRTLIRSSMVSLIIVLMGLFMLCMSRAPRISIDEPLVEGGGVEFDSVDANDQDLASLLNDVDEPVDANSNASDNEATDDSDILALLGNDEENTTLSDQSSQSGDEGLDEILKLLDSGDESSATDNSDFGSMDSNQQFASTETSESADQNSQTSALGTEAMDNLEKEVERLEGVLNEKTTEMQGLQTEIQDYDQKINKYDSQAMSSGGSKTPARLVSSQQVATSEESGYTESSKSNRSNRSSNFDETYNSALEYFYRRDFEQAIDQFQDLVETNSKNALADNCQYWIGESRFAQGKYYQAIAEFTKVFAFEDGEKQDDAQLMLGMAFMKLGDINSARVEFDWLVSCYSSSEYSKKAGVYLGQF
ncbi:MAG TPA: hypothetical protein VGD14_00340 [bacterium]